MINYLTETDLINGIKITPDSLILGDCLEVMKHIPNASIDAIITDPQYYAVTLERIANNK